MPFEVIDTAEIQVKKPVTARLLEKIKNSMDFLNGRIGTIDLQGIQNGSFEIDSDGDGVPDNWVRALYPGGTGLIDTAAATHGTNAFKFTHPGGVGNGGGTLTSDYIPFSHLHKGLIDFIHHVSSGIQRKLVQISFYNKAKVFISTATVYDHLAAIPAAPFYFLAGFTPPAGTCFIKIILTGGHTSDSTAGVGWFDGIRLNPAVWSSTFPLSFTIPEYSTGTSSGFVDAGSIVINVPALSTNATLNISAEMFGYGDMRFRIGANYSNIQTHAAASWAPYAFALPFTADLTGAITLVMQLEADSGNTIAGRKPAAVADIAVTL